ncbi:hypothetical protein GGR92_000849 [Spirosoma lacussanchae]|uniref:bifunctional nuclease family protein n=1 Tax=Spirosoma lacussanchae TaxID=1884249 RepID=UPI0011091B51|nr:bifunctional nuclease family protein [Spirosoma lacussanchae]
METIELSIVALSESLSKPGNYALMLEDAHSKRRIPLIIGPAEAQAIAMAMEKMNPVRPMTHDLFHQTLERLETRLTKVLIDRVDSDYVFFAQLYLDGPLGPLQIDARPSDAIAMAVRASCPVLVTQAVLELTGYYPDDKVRDKKGSYAEYTLAELEDLLARIIRKEDYESAARVRDAIERRRQG